MNEQMLEMLISGVDDSIPNAAKRQLEASIQSVTKQIDDAKLNRTTKSVIGRNQTPQTPNHSATDSQLYTNISEMINGSTNDVAGFGTMLDSLYLKNKKYFSIIKDYEIMPILIPQINRVLMFLVNECLSPDIQNDITFMIKYVSEKDDHRIQEDIDEIKKEMKLDSMLRDVYMNRYKLGREYYLVVDYNKTFDHMLEMMQRKGLNESTASMADLDYLDMQYSGLTDTINECSIKLQVQCVTDNTNKPGSTNTRADKDTYIVNEEVTINFDKMNILIERSPIAKYVEDAHGELLSEAYSAYSMDHIMMRMVCTGSLNEAVVDTSKLETLVQNMKKKKLQRCMIERLDPAKVFKLKIGGKVIGYFHVSDINETNSNVVNFAQSLKDQLLKTRATNMNMATKSAEEVISRELAQKIINTFDPNIGINRIEDIDLMHDYVLNNEIYKGNKRITFYYADEIFDMSRADDSILTNGVFFTKLYATLLLNNIMTKVLRGRGRQIHTVRLGASPAVQRYIQNAMATLTMPENNLGTLHGSFEQILNPFNSASDIIIPTEDDSQKYIETDYIPGQDVDMNDDFLKTLLNAIVSSFGLDSAVIDATNGNLQFARTLSMESLQICNSIRNEQQDLHDSWEAMCLEVLRIMGSEDTQDAIEKGLVKVQFFEPKSLILQNTIDDINNAKNFAEAIADIIPEFNEDGNELKRNKFVYAMVKERTNIDWAFVENELKEIDITQIGDSLEAEVRKIIREYMENIEQQQYGDQNGDGIVTGEDNTPDDPYGGFTPEPEGGTEGGEPGTTETGTDEGGEDLTPEEEDLMNSDDDDLDFDDI